MNHREREDPRHAASSGSEGIETRRERIPIAEGNSTNQSKIPDTCLKNKGPRLSAGENQNTVTGTRDPSEPRVFDKEGLFERLMNSDDLFKKVTGLYLQDTPARIEALQLHIARGAATEAGEEAHAIKGAAAMIGGEALRAVAFEMEKAGMANDMERLKNNMPKLREAFDRLRNAIVDSLGKAP